MHVKVLLYNEFIISFVQMCSTRELKLSRDIMRCSFVKLQKVKQKHTRRLSHLRGLTEHELTFNEAILILFNQIHLCGQFCAA